MANLGKNKVEIMSNRHYGFTCLEKYQFFGPPLSHFKNKNLLIYQKCLESTAYRLIITEAPHDQGKGPLADAGK